MYISFKILIIIIIVTIMLLELSIEIYQYFNLCDILKKYSGNKYAEYIRQVQNINSE